VPLKMASDLEEEEEIRQICLKVPDSSDHSWANSSDYSAEDPGNN